jgi:hypothetical protein
MNRYCEMMDRQQKEFNNFPNGAAFSDEQLELVEQKLGVDKKDLVCVGYGMFICKSDLNAFKQMMANFKIEFDKAIEDDETGDGFVYDMFKYELENHEYCITCDIEETANALGFTVDEIFDNPKLSYGCAKAVRDIYRG